MFLQKKKGIHVFLKKKTSMHVCIQCEINLCTYDYSQEEEYTKEEEYDIP